MSFGMPHTALLALVWLLAAGSARAGDAAFACAAIADDAERLRCYDGAHAPRGQQPGIAAPTPYPRSTWEQRILEDAARETFTLTGARPSYLLYTHNARRTASPIASSVGPSS